MPNPTSERASALSPAMAATIGPNSPASASAMKGLKISGGKLSCTSQLVSVSVRMRSRVAGGEDLCHRASGVVGDDVDLIETEALAELIEHGGQPVEGEVRPRRRSPRMRTIAPCAGRSGAMQRRTSATSQMTLRHRSALTSTPCTKSAAGAACAAAPVAVVDVGDVAAAEADHLARQHGRGVLGGWCPVCLGGGGHGPQSTYQLSVCKEGVGFRRAHAGRTHRGHPGPAHRHGPTAVRGEGFRRHLDRGDPRRGQGEPRCPLPPLRRARPTCSRPRSKRWRTS